MDQSCPSSNYRLGRAQLREDILRHPGGPSEATIGSRRALLRWLNPSPARNPGVPTAGLLGLVGCPDGRRDLHVAVEYERLARTLGLGVRTPVHFDTGAVSA